VGERSPDISLTEKTPEKNVHDAGEKSVSGHGVVPKYEGKREEMFW